MKLHNCALLWFKFQRLFIKENHIKVKLVEFQILSWEQRKLGELFTESNARSSREEILSVSVSNGIYPASQSDRDTNPGASIFNYKIVRKGDVVYNSMRMWQGAVGSSEYDGIVSPAYVVARPCCKIDSHYFGYLLKQPYMLYKYLCESQGNSKDTQTLKYEKFAQLKVLVAPTLNEQQKISNYLLKVDRDITLHQREQKILFSERFWVFSIFIQQGAGVS